ncbi:four helix bundle protein [hydrothermal vent metagenome]|uniref:Four helix bundle protein n=1 Tax=hydrothermal vent metagenome TaxID=652676 RepID=A0A3B0VY89_9ZZZZ
MAVAMAKGDDIQERLVKFAARVIKLSDELPDTKAGRHIAGQILRSGTSPAPNYAEARGAESSADFIHKLKVAHKELNETEVWLQIIIASKWQSNEKLARLLDECGQLARILSASIKTARQSSKQ